VFKLFTLARNRGLWPASSYSLMMMMMMMMMIVATAAAVQCVINHSCVRSTMTSFWSGKLFVCEG